MKPIILKKSIQIDQLKPMIYAIFFTAVSIVYKYYSRPISRHLYSGIFKVKKQNFQKYAKFTSVMFHVKNWSISLKVVNLNP